MDSSLTTAVAVVSSDGGNFRFSAKSALIVASVELIEFLRCCVSCDLFAGITALQPYELRGRRVQRHPARRARARLVSVEISAHPGSADTTYTTRSSKGIEAEI